MNRRDEIAVRRDDLGTLIGIRASGDTMTEPTLEDKVAALDHLHQALSTPPDPWWFAWAQSSLSSALTVVTALTVWWVIHHV